jgi:predicted amidophosphoribosyltransferase
LLLLVPPRPVVARARTINVSCPRCSHELKHLKNIEYCSHCGEQL